MENWHDYFIADFEAGTLTWKPREALDCHGKMWNIKNAGQIAGIIRSKGYRVVRVFRKRTMAHRILYEMANGPIPAGMQVDHIDQNPRNHSLSNLRLATNAENGRNRGAQANNRSGVKGIYFDKHRSKWMARIAVNGNQIELGRFSALEDAAACRRAS